MDRLVVNWRMYKVTIWDLQTTMSRRLLLWAGLSVGLGVVLLLMGSLFWGGVGVQAVAWGAIDAAIAVFGRLVSRRRRATMPDPIAPERLVREERMLRRLLWINTGLDVLYMIGGLVLAYTIGAKDPMWRGHGWGIVIQGGFLFTFDLMHARSVPVTLHTFLPLPFQGPEHEPFSREGGRPAALLVHGFGGTPAEVRPLGESLREAGWTVRGILLPGFGQEIASLGRQRHGDWLAAVGTALRDLQREHAPVLLVGYSMGGALAILAAVEDPPDGLILVAPFWRLGSSLQGLLGGTLLPLLPSVVRPFRWVDLRQARVRQVATRLMPQIDLDDPQVQREIRRFQVPGSIPKTLVQTGRKAYRQASRVDVPILVIQGKHDQIVDPKSTDLLVRRFQSPLLYVKVDADHDLIRHDLGDWTVVEQSVLEFANSFTTFPDPS